MVVSQGQRDGNKGLCVIPGAENTMSHMLLSHIRPQFLNNSRCIPLLHQSPPPHHVVQQAYVLLRWCCVYTAGLAEQRTLSLPAADEQAGRGGDVSISGDVK